MPFADPETRRAYSRDWSRAHPRIAMLPDKVEAADDHWLVLVCSACSGFFDVPRGRPGRLPSLCRDSGCPSSRMVAHPA